MRATALLLLRGYASRTSLRTIQKTLTDDDPLIRFAALKFLESIQPNDRWDFAKSLLKDPVLTVRLEAARVLNSVSSTVMTSAEKALLEKSVGEYIDAQMASADHYSTHLNLGILHTQRGDLAKAEAAYKKAIKIEP